MLGIPDAREFALKSLDRVLTSAWRDGRLAHVVAYGESAPVREGVAGVLDDYVFLGHAALDAWEATGDIRYYRAAVELTDAAIAKFYDPNGGGFFDTETPTEGERRLGVGAREHRAPGPRAR